MDIKTPPRLPEVRYLGELHSGDILENPTSFLSHSEYISQVCTYNVLLIGTALCVGHDEINTFFSFYNFAQVSLKLMIILLPQNL